ncbi:helix-turn-helix domain-containing protein [Gordonia sp. NB41Y]|uniref:helix-turn-helix domain-containing protein n=1 Tax=Gordonia sp. NB41Y TaxID=875808 RepID=UPI0006B14446|nr:helix-turn-helix domain-containing protein [Gordonia sp. NB41Y]KOY49363.1 hypothetical protein ISGA_10765 [Gordonia sp. NB41Y]WLP90511.1 hypothetical protein Q9K23_23935 [Gordonia sp. NB41Y]
MTSNNTRQPDERERAVEALRRRIAGETYQEIADALGYSDRSGSRRAVQRLLDRREAESVDELRAVHGARLEALVATYFGPATKGDTDAAMIVLRAHDRLARLFGTNAPTAVSVGVEPVTDAEFAEAAVGLIAALRPDMAAALTGTLPGAARSAVPEGRDTGEQVSPASVELSAGNDDEPEPWADVDGPEPVARQENTETDGVVEVKPEPVPIIPPADRPELARRAPEPYGPRVDLGGFGQRLGGSRPTVVVHNAP